MVAWMEREGVVRVETKDKIRGQVEDLVFRLGNSCFIQKATDGLDTEQ